MGQAYDKLVNIVQSSINSSFTPEVVEGTVVNDNPVTIEIDKNSLLLDIDFLIIPEHLLEHDVEVEYEGEFDLSEVQIPGTINNSTIESFHFPEKFKGKFEGKLTLKSQLKKGDAVILMSCLGGQRYLVLDRL